MVSKEEGRRREKRGSLGQVIILLSPCHVTMVIISSLLPRIPSIFSDIGVLPCYAVLVISVQRLVSRVLSFVSDTDVLQYSVALVIMSVQKLVPCVLSIVSDTYVLPYSVELVIMSVQKLVPLVLSIVSGTDVLQYSVALVSTSQYRT